MNDNDNRFCVYEHIRNDTGQCFYVGKGTLERAFCKSRNEHHDRIADKYGMSVKIIYNNLTQDEAYQLEREVIEDYVFNKGFGIDIIGFKDNENENGHLTNCTFGGEGSYGSKHTDEWRSQHSKAMSGENNPMYGVNVWDLYTDKKAEEVRRKISSHSSGKNNPMYGISPKDRMDEETYSNWLQKHRDRDVTGSNNPNWNNDTLRRRYQEYPELKKLLARPGSQNGMATPVFVYDLEMNFVREFSYIGECCEWLNTFERKKKKINSLRASIGKVLDTGRPYKKYLFFKTKQ